MVILILIWINIDLFFDILPNGEQYAAGKWVVLILATSKLITSAFSIGGSALSYTRWYYTGLFFTLILMVSSIFLNKSNIYMLYVCMLNYSGVFDSL